MLVKKVFAQGGAGRPTIAIPTPQTGFRGNLGELIGTLITWAVAIGGLLTLMYILMGGFAYVTAGDDAEKAEGARKMITNGVIGLIIIASAFILWRVLVAILNLETIFG